MPCRAPLEYCLQTARNGKENLGTFGLSNQRDPRIQSIKARHTQHPLQPGQNQSLQFFFFRNTDHSALQNEPLEASAAQCQGQFICRAFRLESYSLITYRLRVGPKSLGRRSISTMLFKDPAISGALVQLIQVLGGGFSLVAGADGRYVTAPLLEPISPDEFLSRLPRPSAPVLLSPRSADLSHGM